MSSLWIVLPIQHGHLMEAGNLAAEIKEMFPHLRASDYYDEFAEPCTEYGVRVDNISTGEWHEVVLSLTHLGIRLYGRITLEVNS